MKSTFKYLLCFGMIALCSNNIAVGQNVSDSAFQAAIPKHAIKISYLHFFNRYPTAQFQYETYIGKQNTLIIDIGPVLKIDQESSFRQEERSGLKMRVGVRDYLGAKINKRGGRFMTYLMPELLFNALNDQHFAYFKYPIDNNDFYYKYEGYRRIHREGGLGMNFGFQGIFGSGICFDITTGWAIWYMHSALQGKPDAEMFNSDPNWLNLFPRRGENRLTLLPLLSFRLGYVIK